VYHCDVRLEDLGIIGNGQFAALVDQRASIVWCCLPRFDAEPVFGALLDPDGGTFGIASADDHALAVTSYLENTNILETKFHAEDGSFRVLDFAPRFTEHQRSFHPAQIVRIVEPLQGTPAIRVTCCPRLGWSRETPTPILGSNHVEYAGFEAPLRLTTDFSLAAIDGRPTALTGARHFVLSWGAPVEEPLAPLARRFLDETRAYWQQWVRECNLPPLFQQPVIRSALTLKLMCYEDTGAIIAAPTTSIPEALRSGRTWDYRYCWLRDAYYVLNAFRRLGHFEERERFLEFLLNVAASEPDLDLRPLYRIDGTHVDSERCLPHWAGFNGDGPVRVDNAAGRQRQHDVYGEMVLALAPVFMDDRFAPERTPSAWSLLERLARKAIAVAGSPDAGIWEFRGGDHLQTFSSLMCWVAADRMTTLARRHNPPAEIEFRLASLRIRDEILARGWNVETGSLVSTYDGNGLDAALLQAIPLRLFDKGDPRAELTIRAVQKGLQRNGLLLRYAHDDGFGPPHSAFLICTFWLVEALAHVGRASEATTVMTEALKLLSPLGLLSEDFASESRQLLGNFPQAYSHVGLINAAFAASPAWSEVL
jgi:GH15 family glucan-1,4-alpha-glucosidase